MAEQPSIPKLKLPQGKQLKASVMMTAGTAILVYMVVTTIQAVWQNYQLDKQLLTLREQNAELKLDNKYFQNLIQYRKTDSFKEKEARSKLNYQKPGELVLIIPDDDLDRFSEGNIKDPNSQNSKPRELTNPEKWWQFWQNMS